MVFAVGALLLQVSRPNPTFGLLALTALIIARIIGLGTLHVETT
jgi:hypothetical protein